MRCILACCCYWREREGRLVDFLIVLASRKKKDLLVAAAIMVDRIASRKKKDLLVAAAIMVDRRTEKRCAIEDRLFGGVRGRREV